MIPVWSEAERRRLAVEASGHEPSWSNPRAGAGNWMYTPPDAVDAISDAAIGWKAALSGVQLPWLCWCTDDDWCYTQQELVQSVGWTPVVGGDGSVTNPRIHKDGIFIDFNRPFGTAKMRPHFPLAFHHLFADRLAFWHSDLLPDRSVLERIAKQFRSLPEGKLSAVLQKRSLKRLVGSILTRTPSFSRIFELIGCSTAAASRSQFEEGYGWWRHQEFNPNATRQTIAQKMHWEFGVGTYQWMRKHPGSFEPVDIDMEPYHYTQIGNPAYKRVKDQKLSVSDRDKAQELRLNFDLAEIRQQIGL